MRSNLDFDGIKEEMNESFEKKTKIFQWKKIRLASDLVASFKIERAHLMGALPRHQNKAQNISRRIVCKFNVFIEREDVRRSSHKLKGTNYYITEQFSPEVAAKRKTLFRKMKQERESGNIAWVFYDKLYGNGKVVPGG